MTQRAKFIRGSLVIVDSSSRAPQSPHSLPRGPRRAMRRGVLTGCAWAPPPPSFPLTSLILPRRNCRVFCEGPKVVQNLEKKFLSRDVMRPIKLISGMC